VKWQNGWRGGCVPFSRFAFHTITAYQKLSAPYSLFWYVTTVLMPKTKITLEEIEYMLRFGREMAKRMETLGIQPTANYFHYLR
jgi:hypothetical protein